VGGGNPPPDVLWRKHLALLVYLALSPQHTRTRDHLLGLLWPEKTQDKARHSLNEAVRRLRAGLGTERLISEGEMLRLNAAS
jgi:DNA-binding SARP family transcriptional activator